MMLLGEHESKFKRAVIDLDASRAQRCIECSRRRATWYVKHTLEFMASRDDQIHALSMHCDTTQKYHDYMDNTDSIREAIELAVMDKIADDDGFAIEVSTLFYENNDQIEILFQFYLWYFEDAEYLIEAKKDTNREF